jgi:ABC-type phosphate transport system permease subunit
LTIISINEFAFLCHPSVSPIIKQNKNQAENSKAVYIGYGITLLLYLAVGIIGSLAIHGFHPVKKNNVMDYFSGSWQAPFIGILNFLYFFLIVPIFPFVAKSQIYDVLP